MYMRYAQMSGTRKIITLLIVLFLLTGCQHTVLLSEQKDIDQSIKDYYNLPYKAFKGLHFEAKAASVTVNIDGVNLYLLTIYVAPLYTESVKLRYFSLSSGDDHISSYLESNTHEPSELETISITSKEFFKDTYFSIWKSVADYKCIVFTVLISDFGDAQLKSAGLDAEVFKSAMQEIKLTVACSIPASDTVSITDDEIIISGIEQKVIESGVDYNDISWTQLAKTGTCNTFMTIYHAS